MTELLTIENVSNEAVREIFEMTGLPLEVDKDGDLLVTGNPRTYVIVHKSKKRIHLMVLWKGGDGNIGQKLVFANKINDEYVTVRAAVRDNGGFTFDYYIELDGGVTPKNLVRTFNTFRDILRAAISDAPEGVLG